MTMRRGAPCGRERRHHRPRSMGGLGSLSQERGSTTTTKVGRKT
jgi:hypothetical protein